MANMINELKEVDHPLTDEHQVHVVIHSLSNSWEHRKIQKIHFEGLNIFKHIQSHIELEKGLLKIVEHKVEVYICIIL